VDEAVNGGPREGDGGARQAGGLQPQNRPAPLAVGYYFYGTCCPKFDISQMPSCWVFFDKQYNQLVIKLLITKYMLARMHTHPSEVTLS